MEISGIRMVRDRTREALRQDSLRGYISGNEQMFCVDNNLAKDIKVMDKKLYVIEDDHVQQCNVVLENDERLFYIYKDKYLGGEKCVGSVYKSNIVCDNGEFKEIFLTRGTRGVFCTQELAEEYLNAYKKYNVLWDLQHDLRIKKEKIEQCKKQIAEIEAKIDELMYKQNSD